MGVQPDIFSQLIVIMQSYQFFLLIKTPVLYVGLMEKFLKLLMVDGVHDYLEHLAGAVLYAILPVVIIIQQVVLLMQLPIPGPSHQLKPGPFREQEQQPV